MSAGVTFGVSEEERERSNQGEHRRQAVEAPKQSTKTPEKKGARARTVALGIGAVAVVAGICGYNFYEGTQAQNGKIESLENDKNNLQKTNRAQDWLLDNDITNVSKDNGVYEQNGNIYVRFEDKNCKNPVVFQFDEQQNAAVLNQTDQAGNIYASAKITNAPSATAALLDICS